MNKPFFSVIVPCYNSENFIRLCIDSIIIQSFSDWELILIDDGSTDNTPAVCNSYSCVENIHFFRQKNAGVSAARNFALDRCSGEWIMFIDSDDWFEPTALEKIKELIDKDNPDVLGFNHYYNSLSTQWKKEHIHPSSIIRTNKCIKWFKLDCLFPYLDKKRNNVDVGSIRAVWGKAFRSSLIKLNNIKFEENLKIAEDAIFCFDVFNASTKACFYDEYLMHYRIHNGSVMNRYNPDIVEINHNILSSFYKRIENLLKEDEDYKIAYLGVAAECVFRSCKLYFLHPLNLKSMNLVKKEFCVSLNSDYYKKALDYTGVGYLPRGKKEIILLIKANFFYLCLFLSWIFIKIVSLKNKFN